MVFFATFFVFFAAFFTFLAMVYSLFLRNAQRTIRGRKKFPRVCALRSVLFLKLVQEHQRSHDDKGGRPGVAYELGLDVFREQGPEDH